MITLGKNPAEGGTVVWVSPDGKSGLVANDDFNEKGTRQEAMDAKYDDSNPIAVRWGMDKFGGWRLPTKEELASILKRGTVYISKINGDYWSSSDNMNDPNPYQRGYYSCYSKDNPKVSNGNKVYWYFPVRLIGEGEVKLTDPHSNAAIVSGPLSVGPAPEHGGYVFHVSNDGKVAFVGLEDYNLSATYAEALNKVMDEFEFENNGKDHLKFSDWRFPTLDELDKIRQSRMILFKTLHFWSSEESGDHATAKYLADGTTQSIPKTQHAYILPVRTIRTE